MARTSRTPRIVADGGVPATGLTIDAAIDSYRLSLRAGNKSPATIKTYLAALAWFSRFLAGQGLPPTLRAIRREHIEAFIVALQDAGQRPATVSIAYRSLQPFFKWALGEDEIVASPMARMTPPIVPEEPPAILRDEELKAILDACAGADFDARRDTAIIRLLLDTGMRFWALAQPPENGHRLANDEGTRRTALRPARWLRDAAVVLAEPIPECEHHLRVRTDLLLGCL